MRIPIKNRHYLTDAYVDKFRLEKTPFFNNDPAGNCFYKVQGETVRISGKGVMVRFSITGSM